MSTRDDKTYFEIWIRDSASATFCLIENTPVTSNVASLAFADVDGDAGIDLVYITQDTAPTVHIIHNKYKNTAGNACQGYVANTTNLPFLDSTNPNRTNIYDATANNSVSLFHISFVLMENKGEGRVSAQQSRGHPCEREAVLL